MPAEDTYPFKNISFECHDGTKCSIGEEECLKLSPYQGVVGFDKYKIENLCLFFLIKVMEKLLIIYSRQISKNYLYLLGLF